MKSKNFNLKTAADVRAERIRLQSLVAEKENEVRGGVKEVQDKFNPISGITSLFDESKDDKSTRAVLETGINFFIGRVISQRLGFLPTFITPFVSKTISEQVMKLNVQPLVIRVLDWIIEKTDEEPPLKAPVVFKDETALLSKTVISQSISAAPSEHFEIRC